MKIILFSILFLFTSWNLLAQEREPQKPLDVSGQWTIRFKGVEYGCQNPLENGPKEGTFVLRVTRQGDELSATFMDGKTTNRLVGRVNGTIVTGTVHGIYPENCKVVTDIVGEVIGKIIRGTYKGKELNCETCIWEGEFTTEIAP